MNNVLFVELRKLFQFYLIMVVTSLGSLASKHKHGLPEAGGGRVGDIDGQGPSHLPSLLRGTGQGRVTCGASNWNRKNLSKIYDLTSVTCSGHAPAHIHPAPQSPAHQASGQPEGGGVGGEEGPAQLGAPGRGDQALHTGVLAPYEPADGGTL